MIPMSVSTVLSLQSAACLKPYCLRRTGTPISSKFVKDYGTVCGCWVLPALTGSRLVERIRMRFQPTYAYWDYGRPGGMKISKLANDERRAHSQSRSCTMRTL